MRKEILFKELSYEVIGLAMQVHRELGYGFLEKVYENALIVLFKEHRLNAHQQVPIKVQFHSRVVCDYFADIVVEDSIILELKAQAQMTGAHKAQTLNYLKATDYRLALLINFGKQKLEYERFVS